MAYDYTKIVKKATESLTKDEKRQLLVRAGVINKTTNKVEERYAPYYRLDNK